MSVELRLTPRRGGETLADVADQLVWTRLRFKLFVLLTEGFFLCYVKHTFTLCSPGFAASAAFP